jgi:hypothetical protein
MPYRPAWLSQRNQLSIPFPIEIPVVPPRDRMWLVRERQPKRFPPGWHTLSIDDPKHWRAKHYAQWTRRRKAMGLPHVVVDAVGIAQRREVA